MGSFDGEPAKYRDWIKSNEKYMLLAGGDSNQSKRLAHQTSRGAVSDYIQRYMVKYPKISCKQFKSELNMRFAEVNDPHHAFTMLCSARQFKNEYVQVYAERLYALANDALAKVDVESQLVKCFIDGSYHDFLWMKVIRENPKNISDCSAICIDRTRFVKEISIKVK